jgi:predicted nucleotidyltransferase
MSDQNARSGRLTRETVLRRLRESYPQLREQYGVRRIGLFGSFARGTAGEASDVDLIVEFQQPIGLRFIELIDELEELLGRKVDVLTPAGLGGIRRCPMWPARSRKASSKSR